MYRLWSLGALALLASGDARAWEPAEMLPLELPAGLNALAVGDWGGRVLLALSDDQLRLIDPDSGELLAQAGPGGRALLLTNLDGRPGDELVVCGPAGVSIARGTHQALGAPIPLSPHACEQVARVDVDGVAQLVFLGGGELVRLAPEKGGLKAQVERPWQGGLLATRDAYVALGALGAEQVVEFGPNGSSSFATGGPLTGLAAGPRAWSWALEGAVDGVLHQRTLLEGTIDHLLGADLDADGLPELVVVQREARRLMVLAEGAPPVEVAAVFVPDVVAIGDANGDGCGDLVLGSRAESAGTLVLGDCSTTGGVVAAVGGAGSAATPKLAITTAPVSAEMPAPSGPRWTPPPQVIALSARGDVLVQARVGDPLSSYLRDPNRVGTRFRLRDGAPPGLVLLPKGRIDYTPSADQVGSWRLQIQQLQVGLLPVQRGVQLEVLPADTPQATRASGGVQPLQRSAPRSLLQRVGVQRCLGGLGVAGGASSVGQGWQNLGGPRTQLSGSPAVSLLCEGGGSLSGALGLDAAPTFYFRSRGTDYHHLVAATAVLQVGNERVRVGLHASAGLSLFGGGMRVLWLPVRDAKGRLHGLELRATALSSNRAAAQGMALYTWQLARPRPGSS